MNRKLHLLPRHRSTRCEFLQENRLEALKGDRAGQHSIQMGDLEAVHAFASDPVVCRYTTWGPNTLADTRAFLEDAMVGRVGECSLAVVRQDQVIGSAAVWTTSVTDRAGEMGYTIARSHWAQGHATEVAGLLLDLGFSRLGLERLAATCDPENAASARVLEKAGLQHEGRLRGNVLVRGRRRDSLIFGVLRTDLRGEAP